MQNNQSVLPSLPYINHWTTIGITAGINVVCVLLSFGFRQGITESNFLINIFICGFLTTVIDAVCARFYIVRLRRNGQLPGVVPTPRLIRLLPKNGALLALTLGVFFGFASYGVNLALIRFFGIAEYTLWRIVVWQALFACGLSSVVMQLVVLRMVQPDCALPGQPEQKGTVTILNPLPRFAALKNWFNTVTSDFGFNLVMGMAFGGVVILEQKVVIYPTTLQGIGLSSVIFGVIVALRMVAPVTKSIAQMRVRGELPPYEKPNVFLSRLPKSYRLFSLVLTIPTILVSYLVLSGVLTLFDFQVLNFFQYFIIRTIFVAILTKATIALAVARYRQP